MPNTITRGLCARARARNASMKPSIMLCTRSSGCRGRDIFRSTRSGIEGEMAIVDQVEVKVPHSPSQKTCS